MQDITSQSRCSTCRERTALARAHVSLLPCLGGFVWPFVDSDTAKAKCHAQSVLGKNLHKDMTRFSHLNKMKACQSADGADVESCSQSAAPPQYI